MPVSLSGSILITGSLTTSGTITAQTLVVQTITSSIEYSSGSNIFGNSLANTQTMTGSVNITGSINLVGNLLLGGSPITGSATGSGYTLNIAASSTSGSLLVSGSTSLKGSGSGLFTVDGTSGRLFSVDDSLSGSLFSVNTAAGLPVIEAFSDNTVRIGKYGTKALFVSQSSIGIGKETQLNGALDVSGSVYVTGSLTTTGNITTTGTITAQTLVVQTITASVEYSSGSNVFGNSLANTQTFTGSINITGSSHTIIGSSSFNGNMVITGSITATAGGFDSDLTLKNIVSRDLSLRYTATEVSPIIYTWKDESKGTTPRFGYGAQEIQSLIPEAVYKNGDTLAVDYTQVHTLLIDENTKRIESLEKEIAELKQIILKLNN